MRTYAPLAPSARLRDVRLERRLERMVEQFAAQPNSPIPQATNTRNDMDAAYQFFANAHVSPSAILTSSLHDVLPRLDGLARVLVLQDLTDCNFSSRTGTEGLGYTDGANTRGLLVHSSLAVTDDGLPLGLLTQQIWTRDPALKGKTKARRERPAEDKESYRWADHAAAARRVLPADLCVVHVADREGDIYDWLSAPRPSNAHLLIRVAQARRTVAHGPDGTEGTLSDVVGAQAPVGTHRLEVPRADDQPTRTATVAVRIAAVRVVPPLHAKKRASLPRVPVWVIEAREEQPPPGAPGLCWRVVSTAPIETLEDALRGLRDYALRWRIERFHFVLKQGFKVEELQLETADRLSNAVAVYSRSAVRVLRLAYLARVDGDAPAEREFTGDEIRVLDRSRQKQDKEPGARVRTIREAVRVLARLGGHLGRKGDGLR